MGTRVGIAKIKMVDALWARWIQIGIAKKKG